MWRLFTTLLLVTNLFHTTLLTTSQGAVNVLASKVDYHFGDQAVFSAHFQSDSPIKEVFLFYQSEGKQVQVQPVTAFSGGEISYTLALRPGVLRPFSQVSYWFSITPTNGDLITSPKYAFFYEDNRFKWQSLENDLFVVHWIDGDLSFGQEVQNTAMAGFKEIQNLIPVYTPAKPIDIYVYAHASDLQSAQDLGGILWVAGSASPDLGVVLVSIPAGTDQRLVMNQQVPHELAHVLTYQVTGAGYWKLPVWLTEGIASMAEIYPNADYAYSLQVAKQDNNFIPMQDLCQSFPRDASRAFLAYAQADSFSRYLQATYGAPGMQKLIQSYLDGLGCSEGAEAALGLPLKKLEFNWMQETLKVDTLGLILKEFSPYLIITILIITIPLISFLFARRRTASSS